MVRSRYNVVGIPVERRYPSVSKSLALLHRTEQATVLEPVSIVAFHDLERSVYRVVMGAEEVRSDAIALGDHVWEGGVDSCRCERVSLSG